LFSGALLALMLTLLLALAGTASAQTAHFSYTQVTLGGGFSNPTGVAVDSSGNVFVGDTFHGAVKEIPRGCLAYSCVWTLANGFGSPSGVAVDKNGNVFVVDTWNNAVEEIFAAGGYLVKTLGSGFSSPHGVAVDKNGNVFVADSGNDAVEEILAESDYTAVITVGSGFVPYDVAVDGSGNVFVTDSSNSAVKEIVAVNGSIPYLPTIKTLGSGFGNPVGVAVDKNGNVFVTDSYDNAVKEIVAASDYFTVNTLGSVFSYPYGVAVDGNGNVYVADTGNNRVVKLETLSVDFGTVAIGQTSTSISLTFSFDSGGTIGSPVALTQGAAGLDFAVVNTGTCKAGTYSAGNTCTVNATFTPKAAGLRNGAVLLKDGKGNTIAQAYVHGIGSGPQLSFLPGSQSTVGGGFSSPGSLAVDGNGNVYVADTLNNALKEIPPGCLTASCVKTVASKISAAGLAVDGGGNLFVVAGDSVLEIPPGCITSSCVKTLSSSFSFPNGVAVDGSGNIFVADACAVKEIVAGGGYTTVKMLGSGFTGPVGLAVDGNGNLFLADYDHNVVKEMLAAGGYTTVRTLGIGFSKPLHVAVDGSGNVYVTDTGNSVLKEILAAGGYSTVKTLGSGFPYPVGVAVDGSGNVYVGDSGNSRVAKLDFADAPHLSFGSISTGASSAEQTVTVQNIGNTLLTLPVPAAGSNPSISPYFTLDNSATTACPVVTSSWGVGSLLPAGASCTLSIRFEPTVLGGISGSVVLKDNALNAASPSYATQTIPLQGTGIKAQTITFANPGAVTYGVAPIALKASASSGLPVSYKVLFGPATVSGSTLTITGAEAVTVQATQAGNSSYAAASPVSVIIMVNKAALTVTANNASRRYGTANPAFSYTIKGYKNGDTSTAVSGTASLTTAATATSAVGTYPVTFSTKSLAAWNYSFTYANGSLTVSQ